MPIQHMLLKFCEGYTFQCSTCFWIVRLWHTTTSHFKGLGSMSKAWAPCQKPRLNFKSLAHSPRGLTPPLQLQKQRFVVKFFLVFHIPLCKNLAQVFGFHAPRFIIIIVIWHNWKNLLQKRPTQSKPRRTSNPETQNLSN